MKKRFVAIALVTMLALGGVSAYGMTESSPLQKAGEAFREWSSNRDVSTQVLASYHGHNISETDLQFEKSTLVSQEEFKTQSQISDRDAVNKIALGFMITEEADRRGLSATDEEVEEMLSAIKEAYTLPDGKEMLDEYLNSAGLSFEDYLEDMRTQLPATISKQKLEDAIAKEYCDEHGIAFTKVNQPKEVSDAVTEFKNELFLENCDDIIYNE